MNNQHEIILKTKRNNIDDCLYWGSYYFAREDKIILSKGHNEKSIIFMRSLAKPLQAAVMCDYNIIEDFKLTSKELAVFCASHAGSLKHVELLKKIIKKHGIKISNFELMPQKPLDTRYYNNHKTKLCNNCSGKHLMMILMSKYLNFDIKNYINKNHPLQKLIYKKQEELSCYKSSYLTYDGCGTPLWGLPVENVIKAYFNFFKNKKYSPLILSILKNPYIFGGYDRLDTEIIKLSKGKLFSKVGAGGLVVVYNFDENKIFLLKLAQNNNEIRRLVLFDILKKLNWLEHEVIDFELNQKGQKVAKYCYEFSL